jgi:hypothetical protein
MGCETLPVPVPPRELASEKNRIPGWKLNVDSDSKIKIQVLYVQLQIIAYIILFENSYFKFILFIYRYLNSGKLQEI